MACFPKPFPTPTLPHAPFSASPVVRIYTGAWRHVFTHQAAVSRPAKQSDRYVDTHTECDRRLLICIYIYIYIYPAWRRLDQWTGSICLSLLRAACFRYVIIVPIAIWGWWTCRTKVSADSWHHWAWQASSENIDSACMVTAADRSKLLL